MSVVPTAERETVSNMATGAAGLEPAIGRDDRPPQGTADALRTLRAATAVVHERLHHLPTFARIVTGVVARDEYRALLERLHGFHAALDTRFRPHAALFARYGVDLAPRDRLPRLADDLIALGADAGAIAALPRAALSALPATRGDASIEAALFGQLYVREGSALGGRVIARHLDPLFGSATRGRTFFAGDVGNGARWRATCDALERVVASQPAAAADLAAGATACFADFERWMA